MARVEYKKSLQAHAFHERIAEKLRSVKKQHFSRLPEHTNWLVVEEYQPQRQQQHPQPHNEDNIIALINTYTEMQEVLIGLADALNVSARLRLLFMIIQNSLNIVLMTYSLVRYFLKFTAQNGSVKVGPYLSMLFYGYQLFTPTIETLSIVFAFVMVHKSILDTACKMNVMNNYVRDDSLKYRLTQFSLYTSMNMRVFSLYGLFNLNGSLIFLIVSGTTTYIILLIQFDQPTGG